MKVQACTCLSLLHVFLFFSGNSQGKTIGHSTDTLQILFPLVQNHFKSEGLNVKTAKMEIFVHPNFFF